MGKVNPVFASAQVCVLETCPKTAKQTTNHLATENLGSFQDELSSASLDSSKTKIKARHIAWVIVDLVFMIDPLRM